MSRMEVAVLETKTAETGRFISVQKKVPARAIEPDCVAKDAPVSHPVAR